MRMVARSRNQRAEQRLDALRADWHRELCVQ
jgi:hypothetical protein